MNKMRWAFLFFLCAQAGCSQTSKEYDVDKPIGIHHWADGIPMPGSSSGLETIAFGGFPDAATPKLFGGFWQTFKGANVRNYSMGFVDNTLGSEEKALIECKRSVKGDVVVEIEVMSSTLQIFPDWLLYGDYQNHSEKNGVYFNINKEDGKYQLGDLNSKYNGTQISINDISKLVTITNVPLFQNDADASAGGLISGQLYKTTTDGSTILKIVP
jgi:hypothetical protein